MNLEKLLSYNPNLLKSILLLVLAVSGNFVGNTLGCKTQYHMTNNMYVKHALLIFIIFFTLNYTDNENENPTKHILRALLVWVCYLLFTKQNIMFTGITAGILVLTYVVDTYSAYYKKIYEETGENKNTYEFLDNAKSYLFKIAVLTILVGFGLYFRNKYTEYGSEFKLLTFIFGKTTCESLKN